MWLRPADGSSADRRLSFLGRGAEVGWPRWSADGRTVLFDGASPRTRRSAAFVVGVDQDSGQVTSEADRADDHRRRRRADARRVAARLAHDCGGDEGRSGPARPVHGAVGRWCARVVHRFNTEHDFPGPGGLARWPRAGVRRAGARRVLSDLPHSARRRHCRAGDDRSLAQDAARVVAGRPAHRVHHLGATSRSSRRSDVERRDQYQYLVRRAHSVFGNSLWSNWNDCRDNARSLQIHRPPVTTRASASAASTSVGRAFAHLIVSRAR